MAKAHGQRPKGDKYGHVAICPDDSAKVDFEGVLEQPEAHGHIPSPLAICSDDTGDDGSCELRSR